MASSPPLPTTDEEEEDNGFGKSNFQRAYMKGGITTSPRGTSKEKDGFFNRLSGKALDYQKKKNAQLEEQVSTLKTELQNEMQKRLDQQRNLHAIMSDCNNIQLGNGNMMTILQYDSDNEDPIPLLKQLMKITMEANAEILHKLTVSENKLAKNSKYLQKIHSVVLQLRESGLSGSEYQMMEQLKDMVEISTTNDEFYTIEKAIEGLKADEEKKSFKDLNADAKRGIRIIVYKFDSMQDLKEQTFAKCLDTPEKDSEVGTPISLRRKRRIGDSVLSLKSNRSDVSETLELIEKHASETLQKTADFPHIKPDIEALLCAMYTLQMDNSRTLHYMPLAKELVRLATK
ncbi:uncharacterized protein LOC123546533 isoform X2 [Mercenaria mercenaria]|uniref:uncharacterized protein LOC123546533 isoform X2 n=1 Tax=Mercenaria mercenaria TaxID=6596 RepID=UPI00234EFBAD|nr:uncharacterized protein LOC123546533 isoform X2 [Mercenaria mercenaria]